jgi:hypothetical protein
MFDVGSCGERGIGNDLISSGRLDTVPYAGDDIISYGSGIYALICSQILGLCALSQISCKEEEEALHLGIECLARLKVLNGGYEAGDVVLHGLCGYATGRSLEIKMGGHTNTRTEGIAAGREGLSHR